MTPLLGNHSERGTDRSRRSYVVISRSGRNLDQSLGRTPSQANIQSTAPTQRATPAEQHQETSSA